jgi:hypothetical protein
MSISEPDLKRLWSKAAGRCSYLGCPNKCIEYLEKTGETVLGEMAHVIPRSKKGPRGTGVAGPDTYENLILLCPYHHEMVDKAPKDFPEDLLLSWKTKHEQRIELALEGPQFGDLKSLLNFVARLLTENRSVHQRFGPESLAARENPLSEGARLWSLRKCELIIPNNRKIVNAITRNHDYLSLSQWEVFVEFREHAIAFEQNTFDKMDRSMTPRFPIPFQQMVQENAE